MGDSHKIAPPPNYGPLAAAMQQSSTQSYMLGREQMDWAKQAQKENLDLAHKQQDTLEGLVADARARQGEVDAQAASDRARYEKVFQPLEDSLVRESQQYTPELIAGRAEAAAGRATADVTNSFAVARAAAQDRLESFGIDPSQTRSAALDLSGRTMEAAARVGTSNIARDTTTAGERAYGGALRSEAINLGRGYPGQALQGYGMGLNYGNATANFGNQALQGALSTTASGSATMGTPIQWQGAGNQSLAAQGDLMNTGYKNYMDYEKARSNQSSGWGTALGLVGGIGMSAFMPGLQGIASNWLRPKMAEGGTVPHSGVPVTPDMSPSGGAAIDDVPARLNAGEFVVPNDVVKWKGEEFFQRLIEGSRKKKQEAPAKPRMGAVPADEPPTVSTVPMPLPLPPTAVHPSALPLG